MNLLLRNNHRPVAVNSGTSIWSESVAAAAATAAAATAAAATAAAEARQS